MQKITPFLWFDGKVEEALKFYTSIFPRARISHVMRQGPKGKVMGATFELAGQRFMALNGGPMYKFSPAISFFVTCQSQREVDTLWRKLSAGGKKGSCGWLKDKFGLSWQIIPSILVDLLHEKNPMKAGRVMQAMLKMRKIDIRKLQRAHAGR